MSHISQATNDKQEITTTLASLNMLPENLGKVDTMLADAGYYSDANVASCKHSGIEPFIPPNRDKHNQPLTERFLNPALLPEDAEPVDQMRNKLKTLEGRKMYSRRKSTVEPVFGIIKHVLGFRQFLLRGLEAVSGEWTLVSMAWNIKRMLCSEGLKYVKEQGNPDGFSSGLVADSRANDKHYQVLSLFN